MTILAIHRDWGVSPSIVRMIIDDSLTTIMTAGYLTAPAQVAALESINRGAFEWADTDLVAIVYNGGNGFFTRNATTGAFEFAAPALASYAQVFMTSLEVQGMYAAPKLILPAPGANKLILIDRFTYEVDYGGVQYTNGGVTNLQYDSTVHGAGIAASDTTAAATINGWAADAFLTVNGALAGAGTVVNKGVYLSNQTAAFATGNSPLTLHVFYSIVETSL